MWSGVASALFIALRIQAGLAANSSPSSTNRIPRPMRKSANAMDLIGPEPPVTLFLQGRSFARRPWPCDFGYGFAAAAAGGAAGLPEAAPKYLKKSESGRSRKRVSL